MKKSKRVGRADIWRDEAKYDFDTCLELHTLRRFNWVCTCSQQVGEKAIKSLFLLNGVDYPWTHSIVDLLDELKEIVPIDDDEFLALRHCASELDPHYIETRYPDAVTGNQAPYKYYDSKRSEEGLKNARRLLEWAEKQIQ
ncbi:MAG: HEPN domain-containing protein [Proteobacteria bacterium]|nr:HEPN domain-containing protein [Pseudomonadota bacterium]